MIFLTLFLIPLILIFANFLLFKKKVTIPEFILQVAAQALIAGISVAIIYSANTHDIEIHNGRISSKSKNVVSCKHSYSCNCRQVCSRSGSSQTCSTHCDTCHEHSHDYEWVANTTNDEEIEIDTVDRQGVNEPPRWTTIKIGEPTARSHSYTNYVKACPDTLFRKTGQLEQYSTMIPAYPISVYDYYRANRLIQIGTNLPDYQLWNLNLSEINADLGKPKQINTAVVIVENQPDQFFYALEQKWIGGKKNDAIPVIGVSKSSSGYHVDWVNVMAWTDRSIFKIALRDDIKNLETLDREKIMTVLSKNIIENYHRKSMSEFKYLIASITPTKTQWILSIIFGILFAIGISYWVNSEDVFKTKERYYY